MHDATSRFSHFRLAIASGVTSSPLSALLALQRAEEPEVTIAFSEVPSDDLVKGLRDGRYDAGLSMVGLNDLLLQSQPLWTENLALAMPLRFPLLDHAKLTIAELLDYSVFRWPAEICPALDEMLATLQPSGRQSVQHVTSFEMMALWVAAGYGVGISVQSRTEHARGWGISTRPLSDGPYEVVTHLQRPNGHASPVADRFERRALQVARDGTA